MFDINAESSPLFQTLICQVSYTLFTRFEYSPMDFIACSMHLLPSVVFFKSATYETRLFIFFGEWFSTESPTKVMENVLYNTKTRANKVKFMYHSTLYHISALTDVLLADVWCNACRILLFLACVLQISGLFWCDLSLSLCKHPSLLVYISVGKLQQSHHPSLHCDLKLVPSLCTCPQSLSGCV